METTLPEVKFCIIFKKSEKIEQFGNMPFFNAFVLKFLDLSGAKECNFCRSRKILQNASFLAIVAVDTAGNKPLQNLR